jgi:hypothetical protein
MPSSLAAFRARVNLLLFPMEADSITMGFETKKPQPLSKLGLLILNPAASYSSIERPYSTIGAGGLNGRVRDGIGCITSAIATGSCSAAINAHLLRYARPAPSNVLS